jgi:hypothetical protein
MVAGRRARLGLEEAVIEHVKRYRSQAQACQRRLASGGG